MLRIFSQACVSVDFGDEEGSGEFDALSQLTKPDSAEQAAAPAPMVAPVVTAAPAAAVAAAPAAPAKKLGKKAGKKAKKAGGLELKGKPGL